MKHPTAVALDDLDDAVREMEDDDLLATEQDDNEKATTQKQKRSEAVVSPPQTPAAAPGMTDRLRGPLAVLAAMLYREGIDLEFFPSHADLLEPSAATSRPADPFEGVVGQPSSPSFHVSRPTVFVLPSNWQDSTSPNPFSILDPILSFADCVVVEGLEVFRHAEHPLVTLIPRALGQAAVGSGANMELKALRNLIAPAYTVNGSTNMATLSRGRVCILGDDERGVEWSTLSPPVPLDRANTPLAPPPALSLPSVLLHFVPKAAEALVFAFDKIVVTGTAALIAPNVRYRRTQMRRQAESEGLPPPEPFSLPWSTALEAAVCGLIDAVESFSSAMPRGCQLYFAEDLTFAKMTTSGKAKVEVVSTAAWCRLDGPPPLDLDLELPGGRQLLDMAAPGGSKLFFVDVGPQSRIKVSAWIEEASYVWFCGAVTRSLVHSTEGASRTQSKNQPLLSGEGLEDEALQCAASVWFKSLSPSCQSYCVGEQWLQTLCRDTYQLQLPLQSMDPVPVDAFVFRGEEAASIRLGTSIASNSAGPQQQSGLAVRRHQSLTPLTSPPATPQQGPAPSPSKSRVKSPSRSPPSGRTHTPMSHTTRSTSIAPPTMMGGDRGGGVRLLQGRFNGTDRSVTSEAVHVATLTYPQIASLMSGQSWPALRDLPFPTVSRRN